MVMNVIAINYYNMFLTLINLVISVNSMLNIITHLLWKRAMSINLGKFEGFFLGGETLFALI